ncbi:MAG TPA: hypothetical protein VF804_05340, partial [Holophagaceae bacterium]
MRGWGTSVRHRATLAVLLGASALKGAPEGGWEAFLQTWRKTAHAPLNLLVPASWDTQATLAADPVMLQLSVTGDLRIQPLSGLDLEQTRQARTWGQTPHWLALDRKGDVLDEGVAAPSGEALRGLLLSAGFQPTWDDLDHFLDLHPDHGMALSFRLGRAMNMARIRFRVLERQGAAEGARPIPGARWFRLSPAKILDPGRAVGWDREVADTLRRLSRLPDGWRFGDDLILRFWLDFFGTAAAPEIGPPLRDLREGAQAAWQRLPDSGSPGALAGGGHPTQVELGELWLACGRGLSAGAGLSDLPPLVPAPGRVWPTLRTLNALASQAISALEPAQVAPFLDRIPLVPPGARSGPDDWRTWRSIQTTLAFWRMVALTEQDRWPEANAALQEYRRLSGSEWAASRADLKRWFARRPEALLKGAPQPPEPAPQGFLGVFDLPALPDPPVPAGRPGLRLVIWGKPAWAADGASLRARGPLAAYGPDELRQTEPGPGDTSRLLAAGFPAQGWAVFRGDSDILARGETAPDPDRLALQLEGVAPSRLQVLDAFLRNHPDHLDARKERYDLVRARMPQPALEARLVEDAAAAWLPLDFGPEAPWISDPDRWRAAARKLVPEVQATLDRWPDSSPLWLAWMSWAAFLAKPPSVLAFARDLPVFGSRSAWAANLPAGVHRAILREGRQARRIQDLDDWFSGAWAAVRDRSWRFKPERA